MNEKQAIEWQNAFKRTYKGYPEDVNEACDMAISALEKQIPKKPKELVGFSGSKTVRCANCNIATQFYEGFEFDYCPMCGQKFDWSA